MTVGFTLSIFIMLHVKNTRAHVQGQYKKFDIHKDYFLQARHSGDITGTQKVCYHNWTGESDQTTLSF